MSDYPILYKKTSTGAIQFWEISVHLCAGKGSDLPAEIITNYGQLGTDSPQTTFDLIKDGKNAGKKNATTALQQAEAEALAKWQKQKKKGYVETIVAAKADEVDELIEGGISPMLAQKFAEQGHKIKYPAYMQSKLDGHRCIAIVENGKCTLWSRTRKPINSMPHIVAELERVFPHEKVILDGELYNHDYKDNFEELTSAIRKDSPAPNHKIVQYHIYDVVNGQSFFDRNLWIKAFFNHWELDESSPLHRVETVLVTEGDVLDHFNKFRSLGYEGAMLRNCYGLYVNKRSYDLQKMKEFDDAEFKIVGIEEGRGKLAGHVGSFVCRTKDGKEFLAKMSGDTEKLREYFNNHSLWEGKLLTVQYQGLTGANGLPRFPVGLRMREEV